MPLSDIGFGWSEWSEGLDLMASVGPFQLEMLCVVSSSGEQEPQQEDGCVLVQFWCPRAQEKALQVLAQRDSDRGLKHLHPLPAYSSFVLSACSPPF